jgi:hypothetical protein
MKTGKILAKKLLIEEFKNIELSWIGWTVVK